MEAEKKKPNPGDSASFVSALLFCWLKPLMQRSYKATLSAADLYDISERNSSEYLCEKLDREWQKELQRQSHGLCPSYLRALLRCFRKPLAALSVALVIAETAKILQPLLLARMLHYFMEEDTSGEAKLLTYLYAAGTIGTLFVTSAANQPYEFFNYVVSMRMRIASCALIYRKTLRLGQKSLSDTTTGHIVNLMSTDAIRLNCATMLMPYPWLAPLEAAAVLGILWWHIGLASLPGFTLVLLVIPLQGYMGKLFSRLRMKMAARTDERLQLMDQVLAGMKVIKLNCWEKPFAELVEAARRREMKLVKVVNRLIQLVTEVGAFAFAKFVVGACVLALILSHGRMPSLEVVIVIMRLSAAIQESLIYYLPLSIQGWGEISATCSRIQEFLLLDELNLQHVHRCDDKEPASVELKNYCSKWGGSDSITIRDVTLRITAGEHLAVVGPVGAGKSSLLMALLGELSPISGAAAVAGRLSYAAQQPWIFSASLRQNILFGLEYDSEKYSAIVDACALDKDMAALPNGDQTLVGEKGVMLSGGQKARVSLARALYRDADIYLLDDPLSAVDAAVARHIFERCIKGLVKDRICIFVIHQLPFVKEAARVLVLNEGAVKALGTPAELLQSGVDLGELLRQRLVDADATHLGGPSQTESDEPVSERETAIPGGSLESVGFQRGGRCGVYGADGGGDAVDGLERSDNENRVADGEVNEARSTECDTLLASAAADESTENEPEGVEEGSVSWATYKRYFGAGASAMALIALALLVAGGQASYILADWYLTDWSHAASFVQQEPLYVSNASSAESGDIGHETPVLTAERARYALLSVTTEDVGNLTRVQGTVTDAAVNLLDGGGEAAVLYERVYIYAALLFGCALLGACRSLLFYHVCSKASVKIHDSMLMSIMHTHMRFFDTNPVGRILNRFSTDTSYMDDKLPQTFYECMTVLMVAVGTVTMAAAVNPWVLLPLIPIVCVLVYVRRVYANTIRAVKRVEAVTRSPVLSHLSTSLLGIYTMRAFREQETFEKMFCQCQDGHTKAYYIFLCVNRWLTIRMDLSCVAFVSCLMLLCVVAKDSVGLHPSMFGLVISYALSMTMGFQYAVRQTIEVENMMTSVERIIDYSKLPPEEPLRTSVKPPAAWPHEGGIEAIDVNVKYHSNGPAVLRDMSFSIRGGEKIGICGRTGAGKSSLLAALFRLCEPSGHLTIDGVQITDLSLRDLRSNLSIIPQDPVLFSGTVRKNLDPSAQQNDDALWNSLRQVELALLVKTLPGGLDANVSEGGANFSVGQRQLLCLARALLHSRRIVVVDEATANVDLGTSATIQETIREKFISCTVLTIAHRLDSVMDSDRVMVIDDGGIDEFEEPYVLLQQPDSRFLALVRQTGKDFEHLCQLAKESFERRRRESQNCSAC